MHRDLYRRDQRLTAYVYYEKLIHGFLSTISAFQHVFDPRVNKHRDPKVMTARTLSPKRDGTTCRILSLDGGGAKGFYTLGVLKELEALLGGGPLCDQFEFIYGTSTGAIIAALLAIGKSVDEVHKLYTAHVPNIMSLCGSASRSAALERLAVTVFEDREFTNLRTHIGLVAARWTEERPIIFKSCADQAHLSKDTFVPGFGCTIADAVVASCSAYPIFEKKCVNIPDEGEVVLIDGGYCANNPTLFAIADATRALRLNNDQLGVVSIGVGTYPEPKRYFHKWIIAKFFLVRLLHKTLAINTHSMEQLASILFTDVMLVRVNDTYSTPDMAADLTEHDLKKLSRIHARGIESYRKHARELRTLLDLPAHS